jgi:hypothetical protein
MRHDRVSEMGMRLDAARRHDEAGGVDDFCDVRRQRPGLCEHGNALALHAHVPGTHALGRHDTTAADHEVEHAQSLAQAGEVVK